jgi:hypothetical protein
VSRPAKVARDPTQTSQGTLHTPHLVRTLTAYAHAEVPYFGDASRSARAHFFSHVDPRRIAVVNVRRADARNNVKVATVAQSADNDWWSWALIAVTFGISAAAVWGPVIVGAI